MKKLANVSESKLEDEKKRLNEASRNAHQNALAGKINTEAITGRFNEIGSQQTKYEALELCLDVLRADGTVDPSELEYLDALTKSLGLDPEKYRGLRDRSISDLGDFNVEHEGDLEKALLEIERVTRRGSFITLDAYRNNEEKERMEAWNLTAKTVMHVDKWKEFFNDIGYTGDYYWFIP